MNFLKESCSLISKLGALHTLSYHYTKYSRNYCVHFTGKKIKAQRREVTSQGPLTQIKTKSMSEMEFLRIRTPSFKSLKEHGDLLQFDRFSQEV